MYTNCTYAEQRVPQKKEPLHIAGEPNAFATENELVFVVVHFHLFAVHRVLQVFLEVTVPVQRIQSWTSEPNPVRKDPSRALPFRRP